jgi:hypothetical protein
MAKVDEAFEAAEKRAKKSEPAAEPVAPVEAEAASEQRKKVYVTINKRLGNVREGVNGQSGDKFISIKLPAGTMINGQDFGGYRFSNRYANPAKFPPKGANVQNFKPEDWLTCAFLPEQKVALTKSAKEGEKYVIVDRVVVSPTELATALDDERLAHAKEWRAAQEQGKDEVAKDQPSSLADRCADAAEAVENINGGKNAPVPTR